MNKNRKDILYNISCAWKLLQILSCNYVFVSFKDYIYNNVSAQKHVDSYDIFAIKIYTEFSKQEFKYLMNNFFTFYKIINANFKIL